MSSKSQPQLHSHIKHSSLPQSGYIMPQIYVFYLMPVEWPAWQATDIRDTKD